MSQLAPAADLAIRLVGARALGAAYVAALGLLACYVTRIALLDELRWERVLSALRDEAPPLSLVLTGLVSAALFVVPFLSPVPGAARPAAGLRLLAAVIALLQCNLLAHSADDLDAVLEFLRSPDRQMVPEWLAVELAAMVLALLSVTSVNKRGPALDARTPPARFMAELWTLGRRAVAGLAFMGLSAWTAGTVLGTQDAAAVLGALATGAVSQPPLSVLLAAGVGAAVITLAFQRSAGTGTWRIVANLIRWGLVLSFGLAFVLLKLMVLGDGGEIVDFALLGGALALGFALYQMSLG